MGVALLNEVRTLAIEIERNKMEDAVGAREGDNGSTGKDRV